MSHAKYLTGNPEGGQPSPLLKGFLKLCQSACIDHSRTLLLLLCPAGDAGAAKAGLALLLPEHLSFCDCSHPGSRQAAAAADSRAAVRSGCPGCLWAAAQAAPAGRQDAGSSGRQHRWAVPWYVAPAACVRAAVHDSLRYSCSQSSCGLPTVAGVWWLGSMSQAFNSWPLFM